MHQGNTGPDGPASGRPRLAYVYHPRSFETFEIAEGAEAAGCDLIWVVDAGVPETAVMKRLLRRLGEVVDVTGMSVDEAAAAVGAARPDGILSLTDAQLPWTARVAERLGLPGNTPQAATNLSDKRAQRTALRRGGLLVPGFWDVPADDDPGAWAQLGREAVFPAVVKPRHSQLSRHTLPVTSLAGLRQAVDDIAADSPTDRADLQLEQYIADRPDQQDGPFADYLSVESMVSDGVISHLGIMGRFPLEPPFRETGFFMPAALGGQERVAVLDVATAAIRAVGVTTGFLHTEIKMTPDGPCVIELNGRIGGGVIHMLRRGSGIEAMPLALRLALGEHHVFDVPPAVTGIPYILLVQPATELTRVREIDGVDELRERPEVDAVIINRGPGTAVDWRAGTNEYVLLVSGRVDDHEALVAFERDLRRTVCVHGDTDGAGAQVFRLPEAAPGTRWARENARRYG